MDLYSEVNVLDAFRRTTDGPECPVANCYTPQEFLNLGLSLGLQGHFKGSAISLLELELLPKRLHAIRNRQLDQEHRDFLSLLTFNEKGHPVFNGHVAGIAACYEFTKKR